MVTAWAGLSAAKTRGARATWINPSTAITANHKSMTGPNRCPTLAVPRFCTRKSAASTTIVSGSTKLFNLGVPTPIPSIALNTEIAGVIMLSP